jgi:hypothetical protein
MIRVRANRDPWRGDIELAFAQITGDTVGAGDLTFTTIDEGSYVEPTCRLAPGEAQELMDELWRAGIRPADGTGSTGQLGATERHLADMRGIALAALRAKGVKA